MKILLTPALLFVAVLLSSGCKSDDVPETVQADPAVKAFVAAAERFKEMQQEGAIPGFEIGEHGVIRSPRIECAGAKGIQYPMRVSMQVEKTSEKDAIYWLVFQKSTETSQWELIEAWKTDSMGQNRRDLKSPLP
jgi:hypothetical protein